MRERVGGFEEERKVLEVEDEEGSGWHGRSGLSVDVR